jgi:hypothetical protein
MKIKGFILALGIMLVSFVTNAQSSVFFDANSNIVGYAYGHNNVSNSAYNNAIRGGAVYPVQVLNIYSKGYGAIILGRNRYGGAVIGTAAGYRTLEQARYYAYNAAINSGALPTTTYVFANWFDGYNYY